MFENHTILYTRKMDQSLILFAFLTGIFIYNKNKNIREIPKKV